MLVLALLAPAHAADTEEDAGGHDHGPTPQSLTLAYGMQFTPEAPAHHLSARLSGEEDAYIGAEVRYLPQSDLLWTGRVGLGVDVLGGGDWDLQLGLWVGGAGEWQREGASLYAGPMAGTEVGVGYEGRRLFARYRWLAGIGSGPLDELLTEQELTVGFKVLPEVHAYGQYFVLSPGRADNRSGFGVGARLRF
jgi:hypothetical protein